MKGAVYIALLAVAMAASGARADADPPRAVAVRIDVQGETAAFTFDLSGRVEAKAHGLAEPYRIVVDLPAVGFSIDSSIGRDLSGKPVGTIVKSFRFGALSPERSRIVFDLAKPACVSGIDDLPIAATGKATRLKIALAPCDAAAFAATVKVDPPAPVAEAPAAPSGDSRPVVVVDPGHGGIDGGAYGPGGAVEKAITLAFARLAEEKLEKTGKYRVVATRKDDSFVTLEERVKIAEDAGAALFISIHADTISSETASVSGATVYSGAERATDGESARIAARENAADAAGGAEQKEASAQVSDILFDLKRRESRAYTHLFSRDLADAWRKAARLNRNPERAANFFVLKAPDYPSVLLELGYLSNAEEVKAMQSAEWRDKSTDALVAAVNAFFAAPDSAAAAAPARGAAANP